MTSAHYSPPAYALRTTMRRIRIKSEMGAGRHMKPWVAALALAAGMIVSPVRAAELLVFERPGCPYCTAFDREVAPVYPLTAEGKAIPARRIDITKPIPSDLAFVKVERLTPVFVLIDGGREIGRFRGYAGDDHFWGLLGTLTARLEEQRAADEDVANRHSHQASRRSSGLSVER